MVSNACLFGDDLALSAILATDDPREQKHLDRHVRHFDHEFWQQECEHLVFQGNLAKFSQNEKIFLALVHNARTAALSAFTDSVPDDHAPEVLAMIMNGRGLSPPPPFGHRSLYSHTSYHLTWHTAPMMHRSHKLATMSSYPGCPLRLFPNGPFTIYGEPSRIRLCRTVHDGLECLPIR